MYAEISCFVNVFSSFYIYLELFWNIYTMDEIYFENNDVSLVDREYNSSESDQDQDEPYLSDLPSEKSDSCSSEEGLSENNLHTIERISNT